MADAAVPMPVASPPRPMLKRGLSREEAAHYVGIGVTLFDEMVASGLYPQPHLQKGRITWDLWELDEAFKKLPKRKAVGQNAGPPLSGGWDES